MASNVPPVPPPPPMPSGKGNPYDFILNPGSKPGRNLGSLKQRIKVVAIGGALLLIVIIIFVSILSGGGKGNTASLVSLAQQQNEIARIAAIGVDKSVSATTKNLAITAQLSLESSKQDTIALLKSSGHKIGDKQLRGLQNSKTDEELNTASDGGTFDSVFTKTLSNQLTSYRTSLQNSFRLSANSSEATILQDSFNSASALSGSKT